MRRTAARLMVALGKPTAKVAVNGVKLSRLTCEIKGLAYPCMCTGLTNQVKAFF